MILDILKPGCRVDIRILQQLRQEQETGKVAQIFKSKVCDVKEGGKIQLLMPMNGSKYILLPLDFRYEFVFYTERGLYRCEGMVTERFKSNNVFMINTRITTQPSKFQRREYYRHDCLMELEYVVLTQEQENLTDIEEIQKDIAANEQEKKSGFVLDISGGGVRFTSDEPCEVGSVLLMWIDLQMRGQSKTYSLLGTVLKSEHIETARQNKYQNRVRFSIQDVRVREEIIKFIFEEERQNRSKKG